MLSVIGFLIILTPLVVVHEFGHYWFARIFGVRAETFSVGFGPRVFGKKIGETDWRISAIPLGGYVKLLGEDREEGLSEEELLRAVHRAAPWKRFLIFFGGPLFNFLFAIVIFMAILAIGEKQVASVVGRVVPGSRAAQVGFLSGDRILSIAGQPVNRFDEVTLSLNQSPGKLMDFEVQRRDSGKKETLKVISTEEVGLTIYGEQTRVGELEGLMPFPRSTETGVSNSGSLAGQAGIVTGDQIATIAGARVESWEALELAYGKVAPGASVTVGVIPAASSKKAASSAEMKTYSLTKPQKSLGFIGQDLGLYSSELFVERAVEDSPARKAGLQHGDRIVTVAGKVVQSFPQLREFIQKTTEKDGKVEVVWERAGKNISAVLTPTATVGKDPLLNRIVTYTIGVMPKVTYAEPEYFIQQTWNPFKLLYRGTERMITLTIRNFVSIGKMLTGAVSAKTLGGPIMIGKIAGESLSHGLIAVLTTMGILSIGLGVLNVLPVPVLDGGHLVLLLIEGIRGKPLTMKQMEIIQMVGLGLILMLMVVVFKNDISRLSS